MDKFTPEWRAWKRTQRYRAAERATRNATWEGLRALVERELNPKLANRFWPRYWREYEAKLGLKGWPEESA